MSKAVMISIRVEWCEMIVSRKKTVEVRKSRPRLEPPFKCYIYCTQPKHLYDDFISIVTEDGVVGFFGGGKVIGEFVCDDIRYADAFNFVIKEDGEKALEGSCIDKADLFEYLGWENGMPRAECTPFYRWHISNLIIYDQPRKIGEFRRICHNDLHCESCAMHYTHNGTCGNYSLQVRRPPQSWCYVEELQG